MRRLATLVLIALLVALELAPVASLAQGLFERAPQQAQQGQPVQRPRTLFDLLFGPRQPPPPTVRQVPQRAPQQVRPVRPRRAQPSPPPAPSKPKVPKSANATRVMVIGDSLAGELADALTRLYADDPDIAVTDKSVAASGMVLRDYYDWTATMADHIRADDFDILVVFVGSNDRQSIESGGQMLEPLTDDWIAAYKARLAPLLDELRAAAKPVVWVGLPPMQAARYSAAIAQISGIQRLAAFAGGADFIDIYDRFVDDTGKYAAYGPDINGDQVRIRESDGIHFTNAGADKLAFYVGQAIKTVYRGGATVAVADPLEGTDAAGMIRPPYQGLGQVRLLQLAGSVESLTSNPTRAEALVTATPEATRKPAFSLSQMVKAPIGRADAFGVGYDPAKAAEERPVGR